MGKYKFRGMRIVRHRDGTKEKLGWEYWSEWGPVKTDCNDYDLDTVCRYTGLKDKNGVEIYDHDIVLYYGDRRPKWQYEDDKYIIYWDNSKGIIGEPISCLEQGEYIGGAELRDFILPGRDIEVIGNWCDNTEMVEKTEDYKLMKWSEERKAKSQ